MKFLYICISKIKLNFMKNLLLFVFICSLLFVGCKQKDKQPPLIILNGDNPMTVILNSWWHDPGATIDDNFDGNSIQNSITVTHNISISGPANGEGPTKLTGTYQVTYTAKDKSGNVATVVRTVNVVNSAGKYATKYETHIDADVLHQIVRDTIILSQDITFDTRTNFKAWFPKLGGKINTNPDSIVSPADTIANTIRVCGFFVADSIRIPRQTYYIKEKVGSNIVPYLFQVMGKLGQCKITDTIGLEFTINYKIEKYRTVTSGWDKDTLGRYWKIFKSDDVTEKWYSF